MIDWRGLLRSRSEQLALAVVLGAVIVWAAATDSLFPGVIGGGVVTGAILTLSAIGIVLVYRTSRVINFAQLQMGAVGGMLFLELSHRRVFLRGLSTVCPPCLRTPQTLGEIWDRMADANLLPTSAGSLPARVRDLSWSAALEQIDGDAFASNIGGSVEDLPRRLATLTAPGWMQQVNYWLSALVAVGVAVLLIWVVYHLLIRRFSAAPRLVLTVATLGAGLAAEVISNYAITWIFRDDDGVLSVAANASPIPIAGTFEIPPAVFDATDVASIIVAFVAIGGLGLYLARTRAGIVLRGAVENAERARTLGVNVEAVTARAWMIAGLFSGLAAFLVAANSGALQDGGSGELIRTLTAASVGGLVSLPLTALGAIAIGVIDATVLHITGATAAVSGILLVLVLVVLLAQQRRRESRADADVEAAWPAGRELRPIPKVLRKLPVTRNTLRALTVAGTVWVLAYPWFMSPSQTNLGAVTLLTAIVGLSLLILTGWAGQISLAQMALAALGAWFAAASGLPFLVAVPVGALLGAVAAAVVGLPALRLRGLFLAITTLVFAQAVASLVIEPRYLGRYLPDRLPRPILFGINFEDDRAFYYLCLVTLALVILAIMGLRRSRTARVLIAAKDNPRSAESLGISLLKARLSAFAVSGFFASLAGALLAYSQRGVTVASFDVGTNIRVFLMTIIGGLGAIFGPILGALYFGVRSMLSETSFGSVLGLLFSPGIALIVLLFLAPGGLVQIVGSIRDAWLRRVAARNRIVVPSLLGDRYRGEDERLPILPKRNAGGGDAFVPVRYRLPDEWLTGAESGVSTNG